MSILGTIKSDLYYEHSQHKGMSKRQMSSKCSSCYNEYQEIENWCKGRIGSGISEKNENALKFLDLHINPNPIRD